MAARCLCHNTRPMQHQAQRHPRITCLQPRCPTPAVTMLPSHTKLHHCPARIIQVSRVTPTATHPSSPHLSQTDTPTTATAAVTEPPQLPSSYRRLMALRCGPSFRSVATPVSSPLPTPGPKEVLIRMHYAGVNGGCETFRARGEFAFSPNRQLGFGFPLGAEGCGRVVALGPGVSSLSIGQAVAANDCAAFAEYAIAKAALCTPLPGPPSAEAVALVLSGVTAAVALEATARLQPGECVAVTAAAGGTGHLAVQLALAAGARLVLAVCGGAAKARALQALDPLRVRAIDYRAQDLDAELRRWAPVGGIDVVYEGVGGLTQQVLLRHLAPRGRLLQVGYISEYPHTAGYPPSTAPVQQRVAGDADAEETAPGSPPTSPSHLAGEVPLPPCSRLFWEGLTVQRGDQTIYGQVWPSDLKAIARCRRRVFSLYAAGKLQVWVDDSRRFEGLDSVPDAVEHMLQGGHIGKVVVKICSDGGV